MLSFQDEVRSPNFLLSLFTAIGAAGAALVSTVAWVVRLQGRVKSLEENILALQTSVASMDQKLDLVLNNLLNRR